MNIARLLNLKCIVPLSEVIRTPNSIILVRPYYQTTLQELLQYSADSIECARIVHKLINAVLNLHNLGIVHRDLQPKRILINTKPKLELKILDFHRSTSHYD